MKKVILIGRINKGRMPIGGETAKNQALIVELEKYCQVTALDFYRNKQRPWIFLQTLWALLSKPHATIILSTTAKNIYPLLMSFKLFGIKRHIVHWIIGGAFGQIVKSGRYNIDVLNRCHWHLAESHKMVDELTSCGLKNVRYVPNFRQFPDFTSNPTRSADYCRFVYMSRIMKEKGVDEILKSVMALNDKKLQNRFHVDFYGRMDEAYRREFEEKAERLPNVKYHGMLDLTCSKGYEALATYHAMLFPTYHQSEGFAGAIIDAYVAGVPVVASDWGHNRETVVEGKTGIIIPARDTARLTRTMEDIIEGRIDLTRLSEGARQAAETYRADKVLNEEFLKEIGVL